MSPFSNLSKRKTQQHHWELWTHTQDSLPSWQFQLPGKSRYFKFPPLEHFPTTSFVLGKILIKIPLEEIMVTCCTSLFVVFFGYELARTSAHLESLLSCILLWSCRETGVFMEITCPHRYAHSIFLLSKSQLKKSVFFLSEMKNWIRIPIFPGK